MAFYPTEKLTRTINFQGYVLKTQFQNDIDNLIEHDTLVLQHNLKMNNNILRGISKIVTRELINVEYMNTEKLKGIHLVNNHFEANNIIINPYYRQNNNYHNLRISDVKQYFNYNKHELSDVYKVDNIALKKDGQFNPDTNKFEYNVYNLQFIEKIRNSPKFFYRHVVLTDEEILSASHTKTVQPNIGVAVGFAVKLRTNQKNFEKKNTKYNYFTLVFNDVNYLARGYPQKKFFINSNNSSVYRYEDGETILCYSNIFTTPLNIYNIRVFGRGNIRYTLDIVIKYIFLNL